MNKKIIELTFMTCNSLNICSYNVKIYKNNDLVFKGMTNKYGCLIFKVPCYGIYKIILFNCRIKQCLGLYIDSNTKDKLLLNISPLELQKEHLITINLTDQHYIGLPITKGKMILWQNNT